LFQGLRGLGNCIGHRKRGALCALFAIIYSTVTDFARSSGMIDVAAAGGQADVVREAADAAASSTMGSEQLWRARHVEDEVVDRVRIDEQLGAPASSAR